jgi:hypothetical protein
MPSNSDITIIARQQETRKQTDTAPKTHVAANNALVASIKMRQFFLFHFLSCTLNRLFLQSTGAKINMVAAQTVKIHRLKDGVNNALKMSATQIVNKYIANGITSLWHLVQNRSERSF